MADPRFDLPTYLNTFDRTKGFQELLFQWDRFLHTQEMNVTQAILADRIKRIADALFRDGKFLNGGSIKLGDVTNGMLEVSLDAGEVYILGSTHDIEARTIRVPATGIVTIGIRMQSSVVTHEQDITLRGMVPLVEGYLEPGAAALVKNGRWGWSGDGEVGDFFAVYTLVDGVLMLETQSNALDDWLKLLEQYDRESHKNYVVEGFRVQAIGFDSGTQSFSVSEGTADVWGRKLTRLTSTRLVVNEEPDIKEIDGETHGVVDAGPQTFEVRYPPIAAIVEVLVTREKTVQIVHGVYSGAMDLLPNETVTQILSVTQGATTFQPKLKGSSVDWTGAASEPAPGSTYVVTYRYMDIVPAKNVTDTTFEIDDAAENSTAFIKYRMKLPRFDAIVVNRDGNITYQKGIASLYAAKAVTVSPQVLKLADIENLWGRKPNVTQVGPIRVPVEDIRTLMQQVHDLTILVAEERLQRDLSSRLPTDKRGVVVDPFTDDDMRDQGIPQTAAVVGNALVLPISADIQYLAASARSLEFGEEYLFVQPLFSGGAKINAYQAYNVMPARVSLDPPQDLWSEEETSWTSRETSRVYWAPGWHKGYLTSVSVTNYDNLLSSQTVAIENIRQRQLGFTIDGFGPMERLIEVKFDGVDVTDILRGA